MKKIATGLILLVVLAVAIISIFWFTEASIYYWDQPYQYRKIATNGLPSIR